MEIQKEQADRISNGPQSSFEATLDLLIGLSVTSLPAMSVPPNVLALITRLTGFSWVAAWGITAIFYSGFSSLLLLLFVRRWELLPFSSVGFKPVLAADLYGIVIVFISCSVIDSLWGSFLSRSDASQVVFRVGFAANESGPWSTPPALRLCMILVGVFAEDVGYRGYVFERLLQLLRSQSLAALISFVADLAAHIPGYGIRGTIAIAPGQLTLLAFYLRRQNVIAVMLAHAFIDCYILF